MQKKLIALAVAGLVSAPVFAQSNVTIYGRMDVGLFSTEKEVGDTTLKDLDQQFEVKSNGWTSSRIGFKGTEDLGNGLKAIFQFETGVKPDADTGSSNTFSRRSSYVGLTGGFGTFMMGYFDTPLSNWLGDSDATDTSAFATAGTHMLSVNTVSDRISNSIAYAIPETNGFQAAVQFAPDEDESVKKDVAGIGLRYDGGPLMGFYTYHEVKNTVKSHAVGLSYDFGVVKVLGNYLHGNIEGASEKENGWTIGVQAPVGSGVISLSYGGETDVGGVNDNDWDTIGVTYKHNLSKRTLAYVGYKREDPDKGDSQDTFGVGIAHYF